MKKIFYIFLTLCFFLFLSVPKIFAQAPEDIIDETIPSFREKAEDLASQMVVKIGDYVEINKDVNGDLHIVGSQVGFFSRVQGDLLVAGGKVLIDGEVDQDLRVIGGEVILRGKVGRNATILGGKVRLEKTAQVSGNLLAAGGEVFLDERAQVVGQKIVRSAPNREFFDKREVAKSFGIFFIFISGLVIAMKWISILVIGSLLVRFFPKSTRHLMEETEKRFGKRLLYGIVIAIVGSVAAIVAFCTIIGAYLALLMFVILALGWYIAKLMAITFSGYFLLHKLAGKKLKISQKNPSLYASFLLGVFVFIFLSILPFVGSLIKLLLILACFGALYQGKLAFYKKLEK